MQTQHAQLLTEEEYTKAVRRIYDLIQQEVPSDSTEFAELGELALAVEHYEQEYFPMPSLAV
jgi:antitoxin component HigA of HigAB toxin-antitoxin module